MDSMRCTYYCSVIYSSSTVREDAYGPRSQIIVFIVECYSSSRICIIICKKSCTSFSWRKYMRLQNNDLPWSLVHHPLFLEALLLHTKIRELTCWNLPKDVTVGSEEIKAGSHRLIASWRSFKWVYLGCLIRPDHSRKINWGHAQYGM